MNRISLSAYAKINLSLAVTGIRSDGYHLLESVMQQISLADTVEIEPIPSGIMISCSKPGIPTDEKNICHKAAKAYFAAAGISGGVKIHLTKCIPDGAGLGGGSADGAAVLKALSHLYPAKVDLLSIASSVGADVPFCLAGGTRLCRGIGDEMTPLSFPGKEKIFCVVAKSCEGLSTPQIYSLFDTVNPDGMPPSSVSEFAEHLEKGEISLALGKMQNHLELPAITQRPEIAECKDRLLSFGANAAMMTGSGSAVFGLFFDEKKARLCAEKMKKDGAFSSFCTLL